MLVGILIFVNFPLYLLLAKVFLPEYDIASVLETSLAVLFRLFMYPIVRVFWDVDDAQLEMSWGEFFRILLFLICCGLAIYGEHWLITKYWWN